MTDPDTKLDEAAPPPRRRPDGRFASRIYRREDGVPHSTRVVGAGTCRNCGKQLPVRAEGRQREFCDPRCRIRFHRRTASS